MTPPATPFPSHRSGKKDDVNNAPSPGAAATPGEDAKNSPGADKNSPSNLRLAPDVFIRSEKFPELFFQKKRIFFKGEFSDGVKEDKIFLFVDADSARSMIILGVFGSRMNRTKNARISPLISKRRIPVHAFFYWCGIVFLPGSASFAA